MAVAWQNTLEWHTSIDGDEEKRCKDILRNAIESDDSSQMEKAALTLDELMSQPGPPRHAKRSLRRFQYTFTHASLIVPHDSPAQDKLVTLLFTCKQLPERGGHAQWADVFDDEFYTRFDEGFEGAYNADLWTGDTTADSIQQTRYRNYNAFAARLAAAGVPLNLSCAIQALNHALERPDIENQVQKRSLGPLEYRVNIAIDWLQLAGDKLFGKNEDLESYVGRHQNIFYRPEPSLWTGPYYITCVERWKLWMRLLKEASNNESFAIETRKRAAENADAIMERINCAVDRLD